MSVVFDARTGRLVENGATTTSAPARLEPGHKRGQTALRADRTDAALRGIPVIGHGGGAIRGSAPGGEVGNLLAPRRVERQLGERDRLVIRERIKQAREELRFRALASRT